MPTTTVRISRQAREEARVLAEMTGRPMSEVIEDAILAERRRLFWRQFRKAAARVEADVVTRGEEKAETTFFEGTLLDGLEGDDAAR